MPLADIFTVYVQTKILACIREHFQEYHLLLDEQAEQIFATTGT
jgi:hypothetical protein